MRETQDQAMSHSLSDHPKKKTSAFSAPLPHRFVVPAVESAAAEAEAEADKVAAAAAADTETAAVVVSVNGSGAAETVVQLA